MTVCGRSGRMDPALFGPGAAGCWELPCWRDSRKGAWGAWAADLGTPTAAPAVSFVLETNIVATAAFSVTVSGVSFGTLDATPSGRVGMSSCPTTGWASGTSVVCLMSLGVGTSLAVQATVAAVAGTQTAVFTYDGTALSGDGFGCALLRAPAPLAGSAMVLHGNGGTLSAYGL